MSDLKSMDLNDVLSSQTLLDLSGVIIGDDLKDTLKINSSRVNKNTGDYYTPTLIIFNYVRYVNNEELMGCKDKDKYLIIAKILLSELRDCGFEIGDKWDKITHIPYTRGNKKLSKDTIIINVSPASLCISSNNGMCEMCEICYAVSSEKRYINSLIFRLTQLIRFDMLSASSIALRFINLRGVKWLRINEAGDVFNMEDVKKLHDVAKILFKEKRIRSYIYTHREDLFDDMMRYQTHYFKINRSGVDFISSPSISSNHQTLYCDGNCKYCLYCKLNIFKTPVTVLYHGDKDGEDLRDVKTRHRDFILKWRVYKMWYSGYMREEILNLISSTLSLEEEI